MDPNATLRELRNSEAILRKLRAKPDTPTYVIDVVRDDVKRLRRDLDNWIAAGGFRPRGY